MTTAKALTMGVDTFTRAGILEMAALRKGLKLRADTSSSEDIKTYLLNDHLLAMLADRGIKRQSRPDYANEIFTLVDKNPQETMAGQEPSNYWNFQLVNPKHSTFELRVILRVGFKISTERRGIVCWPQALGTFLSPADHLPNFRMFKALTENDIDTTPVARELAASDGSIVVTWSDLNLGGLRTNANLFAEFSHGNQAVKELGEHHVIFHPTPYPPDMPGEVLFVAETAQPRLFQTWRTQLNNYRNSLTI